MRIWGWMSALVATALLAACGGGSDGQSAPPAQPSIASFDARKAAYLMGERAQLTPVFSGGSGRIEPGVGPVQSGVAIATPALEGDVTYRLIVEASGKPAVSRALALGAVLVQAEDLDRRADGEHKAAQIGRAFASTAMQHPSAVTHLLLALDFAIGPSFEVVIAGSLKQAETRSLLKKLRTRFLPNKVVLLRKPDEEAKELSGIAPFIEHMALIDGRPAAYVCSNFACSSPTTDAGEMLRLLKAGAPEHDQRC